MPGGQPAHHEQAELITVGQVELRRAGQPLVDLGQLVAGEAKPAVLDLHGEAAAHAVGPDLDRSVRRGEGGGVLDQLGDQVDDVVHRGPGYGVTRLADHVDPGVVLDLGDRRAQHVDDRYRLAPSAARG